MEAVSAQVPEVKAGRLNPLCINNYRLRAPLGADGPAGRAFVAEHVHLGHTVVLRLAQGRAPAAEALARLGRRVAAAGQLRHEQIIAPQDLGLLAPGEGDPGGWYAVSPFIAGMHLAEAIARDGPWTPARTLALVEQIARLLDLAHRQQVVHGALRPSKVRLRPDGQVCLVDFGLAVAEADREPAVTDDLRALGRLMYLCLTGQELVGTGPADAGDIKLPAAVPPLLREICLALLGEAGSSRHLGTAADLLFLLQPHALRPAAPAPARDGHSRRVLVVDDEQSLRTFCAAVLDQVGMRCTPAVDGLQALQLFRERPYDLVVLDIDMPRLNGLDTCRELRHAGGRPHLKIVLMSGRSDPDVMASMLLAGADDYLIKPFTPLQLQARVQAALRLQTAQERGDELNGELLLLNRNLEAHLRARDSDLVEARNALVLALAKLVESRDIETGAHLLRLQTFSRRLAEEALADPVFVGQLDRNFIDLLACCAPLHDIGKVGLPDHILLKPGKLEPEERRVMQTHTLMGAETLQEVARQYPFARTFLRMAIDIARHHHERYDGLGYPDHLAGEAIPLAARIVTVCDVYDALRSRRVYKAAMSHAEVVAMMRQQAGTQFDPDLITCFERCADDFGRIYRELSTEAPTD